ncbi:hypothetical protein V2J09_012777 [Rumex salicifolius]
MASSTALLLLCIAILSLLPLSFSVTKDAVEKAADVLSNSGYISMSLTLQVVSQTLMSNASNTTIFSPSDDAFFRSGGPSMSLLQLHCSSIAYSIDELRSIPFGSKIPTLLQGRSLFVTTLPSDDRVSINGVKIGGSPIYDDENLVVFAADEFFDPDFQIMSTSFSPIPMIARKTPLRNPNLECPAYSGGRLFAEAGEMLRSKGFSIIASFLDLQLVQFDDDDTQFTVFAPIDEALQKRISDFHGLGSLFLKHVVPCEVSVSSLIGMDDGAVLNTILEEFWINVTRSDDLLMLNGVPVVFPDLYLGDRLTVHGIQDVFAMPEGSKGEGERAPIGSNEHKFVTTEF